MTPSFEGTDEMMQTTQVYRTSVPDAYVAKLDIKDNPPASRKIPAVALTETRRKMPRSNIGTSKPLSAEPPAGLETLRGTQLWVPL